MSFQRLHRSFKTAVRFYGLRIRHASLGEVFNRGMQGVQRLRIGLFPVSDIEKRVGRLDHSHLEKFEMPKLVASKPNSEIDDILNGKIYLLGNRDGYENDVRMKWEPARLQHLATLNCCLSQNGKGPQAVAIQEFTRKEVFEWIYTNPFPSGTNYRCAMECGLRVPVFFSCLKTCEMEGDEAGIILQAIYLHAWLIFNRLSLYSSLGNHTIAEAVGLVFAGGIFNNLSEGNSWLQKGVQLLRQEVFHQILDDGGPCEQSFSYHRFVLDLYWLAVGFLEGNQIETCDDIKNRVLQGERFLAAFCEDNGVLPRIGDSDDGYAVAPTVHPKRAVVPKTSKRVQTFDESGYSVVHLKNGVQIIFDHGPLGMPPFYNHGHADALSVLVSRHGKELLVDPGTYRYNGVPEYRRYFKGTRAHNTVTVDGLDQAVQETSFIWSKPYECVLEEVNETNGVILLQASHNGYTRLKQPVIHQRTLVIHLEQGLLIRDRFIGKGIHNFELNFHLHPDAMCTEDEGWFAIEYQRKKHFLQLKGKEPFRMISGQVDPPFGWYSPAYGIKNQSTVLSGSIQGATETITFLTAIGFDLPLEKTLIRELEGRI